MGARTLALGRLLRLSLAPSALADAAAGIVLASGLWPGHKAVWLLIGASSCVYHGGMALNDWADREEDARVRPDRPLPSGAIQPAAALGLALFLLGLGMALAFLADPLAGQALALVAACAVLYDLRGRGAMLGPALLGLCRAGNLGAGLVLGSRLVDSSLTWGDLLLRPVVLVPPLLYGAYVFFVSRLGRLEDRELAPEETRQPPRLLRLCAASLCGVGLLVPFLGDSASIGSRALPGAPWGSLFLASSLSAVGAWALLGAARRKEWSNVDILHSMGLCLRRLLVLSAAVALGAGSLDGVLVAGCILAGYPASYWLRRVFPPS